MAVDLLPPPSDRVILGTEWAPPAGTRVVSVDDHVLEPVDLFRDGVSPRNRDRAPLVRERGIIRWIEMPDKTPLTRGFSAAQVIRDPEFVLGRPGMRELDARIADMDAESVD